MTTRTDAARGGTEATAGAFAPTVPPRRWRTVQGFPHTIPNQRPKLEAHAQKNIALWHAFLNEVRAAGVNNVRAIRSA